MSKEIDDLAALTKRAGNLAHRFYTVAERLEGQPGLTEALSILYQDLASVAALVTTTFVIQEVQQRELDKLKGIDTQPQQNKAKSVRYLTN